MFWSVEIIYICRFQNFSSWVLQIHSKIHYGKIQIINTATLSFVGKLRCSHFYISRHHCRRELSHLKEIIMSCRTLIFFEVSYRVKAKIKFLYQTAANVKVNSCTDRYRRTLKNKTDTENNRFQGLAKITTNLRQVLFRAKIVLINPGQNTYLKSADGSLLPEKRRWTPETFMIYHQQNFACFFLVL